MKRFAALVTSAIIVNSSSWAGTESQKSVDHLAGFKGCQNGESWDISAAIPDASADQFKQFLSKRVPPVRGFSEALALRRLAQTAEQKYFGEYWVSRALFSSKLVHIAKEGFTVLASRPVTPSTVGIQLAALECLTQIHDKYPAIEIPVAVINRIPEYLANAPKDHMTPVWDIAAIRAMAVLGRAEKIGAQESEKMMGWLSGSPAHLALVKGMIAAQHADHSTTIQELKKFAAAPATDVLARYVDDAHLLTARAYYSLGQYEASIDQFKLVSKSSNNLATALEELSWAYLMAEQYREAIGTAMNLQAGGLRKTFAPEAPMVMAMAMNEICQFPDSLNAATIFRKNYEASYKWLDHWRASGRTDKLYKLAIQYLRKQGDVPLRLASEWVRSPLFLSSQDEINLLFDEKDSATVLNKAGSKEQNRIGQEILGNLKELKPAFYAARAKLKPGEELPKTVKNGLQKLKEDVIAFRRMQKAAPVWKAVLANHQKHAPEVERRLASVMESDLRIRTDRMATQLEETAENLQLIEVEIYNGASEDIIWQNAHPEYKKMAKELDETDVDRSPASKVWDWGRTKIATDNEEVEVWEDELGSFKADLVDNCSSKDKYLALKGRRGNR